MAITKEKLRENTISIIKDLEPTLIEKLDTLLDSGAIDFDNAQDNYKLSKMIVSVMGEYIARAYKPPYPSRADNKELKNLRYFI